MALNFPSQSLCSIPQSSGPGSRLVTKLRQIPQIVKSLHFVIVMFIRSKVKILNSYSGIMGLNSPGMQTLRFALLQIDDRKCVSELIIFV